ncbi:PREDICTED: uncharacterized protein LOC104720492 [Camelina sativa]|uniref:Uncharacterized protein LOC104720492 n=1 Tax=Camelina sativa TaxID=90675 RepID=A0ABM0U6K9_CAMSA|nr:PREDICTED: uncharacterized protein LOC104720492 [Camelina sativa]
MQGSSHQVIPIFNGKKYDFWSIKMATIFRTRNLWSVVEEGVPAGPVQKGETPETARAKTLKEDVEANDTMALQILQTAVTDQIFSRIAAASSSKEAWDALKDEYQGSPQLSYHGEKESNSQLIQKLLISLPAKFDSIHEKRELLHEKKAQEREHSMFVPKEENPVSNKTTPTAMSIKARSGVVFTRAKTTQQKSVETNRRRRSWQETEDASEESTTTLGADVWLIDSGCTNHMTKEERYFSHINRSIKVPIRVGNGDIVMTAGKGDITVMTSHGKKIIKNVFLVPGLEKNLLSVPQIISSVYQVRFQDKRCIIQDANGKEIMDIQMTNKSFKIKLSSVEEEAMTANAQMEETWHKRLGHVSSKRS